MPSIRGSCWFSVITAGELQSISGGRRRIPSKRSRLCSRCVSWVYRQLIWRKTVDRKRRVCSNSARDAARLPGPGSDPASGPIPLASPANSQRRCPARTRHSIAPPAGAAVSVRPGRVLMVCPAGSSAETSCCCFSSLWTSTSCSFVLTCWERFGSG